MVSNGISTPIGTVIMYAGELDSAAILNLFMDGWVPCDGSAYATSKLPDLYMVIGESYGGEAGEFCVPSYKGYFLRGTSGTSQRDPNADHRVGPRPGLANKGNTGNHVGSAQPDDFQTHTHSYDYFNDYHKSTHTAGHHTLSGSKTTDLDSAGDKETRPLNQYVNFIIKATTATDVVPPGAVIPYAGSASQARQLASLGWLLCDGSPLGTDAYPNLFKVLQTYYGGEPGKYYLPDYRGQFIRGVQGTALSGQGMIDPDAQSRAAPRPDLEHPGNQGNVVGSVQGTTYKNHDHDHTYNDDYWSTAATLIGATCQAYDEGTSSHSSGSGSGLNAHESRPINIYTNFIIKCQ